MPFIFFILTNLNGQKQDFKEKVSFVGGYGINGNIFVRAKDYGYRKKFIGTNLGFNTGLMIGKNSELRLGYTRQENQSRRIIYSDGVSVFINSQTRHVNNFFELLYSREFTNTKHIFKPGLGIVYMTFQQEEASYGPGTIEWEERNKKYNNLEDAGLMAEMAYEYKFQPRVNIGMRSQFYFNVTAGIAESVTLYPYIKILF